METPSVVPATLDYARLATSVRVDDDGYISAFATLAVFREPSHWTPVTGGGPR